MQSLGNRLEKSSRKNHRMKLINGLLNISPVCGTAFQFRFNNLFCRECVEIVCAAYMMYSLSFLRINNSCVHASVKL